MSANYYDMMSKAISSLPTKTKEFRSLQYERARRALLDRLNAPESNFSTQEVERELFALDRAIERKEWEFRNERIVECVDASRFIDEMQDILERLPEFAKGEREIIYDDYADLFKTSLLNKRPRLNAGRISEQHLMLVSKFDQIERDIVANIVVKDENIVRKRLADTASPKPTINNKGKLHVAPNEIYDRTSAEPGLEDVPIRQCAVIDAITAGLPQNSPAHVKRCLAIYKEQLELRNGQPIIGILQDAMSIIRSDFQAQEISRDWLEPGVFKAFEILQFNHSILMSYYPRAEERNRLYNSIETKNEHLFQTEEFTKPFVKVADAAAEAKEAGWATQDFVLVVDKMQEFARTISALPYMARQGPHKMPTAAKVVLLSSLGFFIGTYNLVGSTASIFGATAVKSLLGSLSHAIEALARLIS